MLKVAILDTGCDPSHRLLKDKNIKVISMVNDDGIDRVSGHGLWVCDRFLRNAPECELYSIKVLDDEGNGDLDILHSAIKWCIDNKINLISMSLGTSFDYHKVKDICNEAYKKGIALIAAAGNEGNKEDTINYPAKYESVIAVGAVTKKQNITNFSSGGNDVEFVTYGADLPGAYINNTIATLSGTSMACPIVASMVANLMIKYPPPKGNIDYIRYALRVLAKDLGLKGKDRLYGYGFLGYLYPKGKSEFKIKRQLKNKLKNSKLKKDKSNKKKAN